MTKKTIYFLNVFFVINFIYYLIKYLSSQSYDYTKQSNFINYSQGFVRRGLWGELMKLIHYSNINTFIFIEVFSLSVLLIIIYYFYKKFKLNDYSINFLFLPFTISYIFLCGFVEFKDYFLLLIFILIAKVIKFIDQEALRYILINSLTILGILIHEMFFFLTVPFLLLYCASNSIKNSKFIVDLFKYFFVFSPIFVVFFAVVHYHGNAEIAQNIFEESLKYIPEGIDDIRPSGGILSLEGQATNRVHYMFKGLLWNGFSRGVTYTLFIITLLYITLNFNFFKNRGQAFNKNKHLFFIFNVQLIAMLPVFIFAIDWCRFISLALLSSLIVFFELDPLKNPFVINIQNSISQKADGIFKRFIKDDINTFYIVNYFCIIPYLEFGNTPWQFTNSIIMLMNYITKVISIL